MKILIFILSILFLSGFNHSGSRLSFTQINPADFKLGNEVLITEKLDLIKDSRVGIITNQSGITSNGTLIIDALKDKANIVKIFSPEHGFRGDDNTGNFIDVQTGINVVSLYGSKKKPSTEDLSDVDVLVYDIQDVGARFYTYVNTLYYCMEAASKSNTRFIVCDRPSLINLNYVDGFMLEDDCKSFVGLLDVPISYGLTCGELSKYLNDYYFEGKLNLEVVEMNGYTRNTNYTDLNLKWVNPSPSIYFPSSAVCYTGTCLFEGTNLSEGRGTDKPFEYIGAPYVDADKLIGELEQYNLPGVKFEKRSYVPSSITSPSNPPKYVGEQCEGVYINVEDKNTFKPVETAIAILISAKKLFPQFSWRKDNFIDKLAGTKSFRSMVNSNEDLASIVTSYQKNLDVFKSVRDKYIIYN